MSRQLVLNPNQFRYHVDGFEESLGIEDRSCPVSSNEEMTPDNGVTERFKQPERAETPHHAVSVSAKSTFSEGLSQAVSPEPDSESSKVSSWHAPGSGHGGSAGNESLAGFNAMIPKAPSQTSRDALDEAIEEVAEYKDLV